MPCAQTRAGGRARGPDGTWAAVVTHVGRPRLKSHLTLWRSALLQMRTALESALVLSFLYVDYSYHENNLPGVYISSKSHYS